MTSEDDDRLVGILAEVVQRRFKQIDDGWTPEHDAQHGLSHLFSLIETYTSEASFLFDANLDKSRDKLLDVLALSIAAVELMDRETDDA